MKERGPFSFFANAIASAARLGLPLLLLFGLVNLLAMGPTNGIEPPLIRFGGIARNLTGRDRGLFSVGLFWGLVQLFVVTILVPVPRPYLEIA